MHDIGQYNDRRTKVLPIDRELRELVWRVQSAIYIIGDQLSLAERLALEELVDLETSYAAIERYRKGATFG